MDRVQQLIFLTHSDHWPVFVPPYSSVKTTKQTKYNQQKN